MNSLDQSQVSALIHMSSSTISSLLSKPFRLESIDTFDIDSNMEFISLSSAYVNDSISLSILLSVSNAEFISRLLVGESNLDNDELKFNAYNEMMKIISKPLLSQIETNFDDSTCEFKTEILPFHSDEKEGMIKKYDVMGYQMFIGSDENPRSLFILIPKEEISMETSERNQASTLVDLVERSNQEKSEIKGIELPIFAERENAKVKGNMEILMDIPLVLSVELGRSKKPVSEIISFTKGSVIELDRLAGEPVDILVNNQVIAKGEVVVIDENFGVRITEIISKEERIHDFYK